MKIIQQDAKAFAAILSDEKVREFAKEVDRRYLHWDRLKFIAHAQKIAPEMVWALVKITRQSTSRVLPLTGHKGIPLRFNLSDAIQRELMMIDQELAGRFIADDENPLTSGQKERFIISALREEAIASSMLEGAVTTRTDAKKMLQSGRKPRSQGEKMVLNNYQAIMFIRENRSVDMSPQLLLELQKILTKDTLDDANQVGRWRTAADDVDIVDIRDGEIIHTPPPANELEDRINRLCEFANDKHHGEFIHPVVKACILHFQLGFDHPFCDGNGRTARAVFYWYMLRSGYWLFEYLPLSRLIIDGPSKYVKAYLYCETDEFDVTYFLAYNARIISRARHELKKYIKKKLGEIRKTKQVFTRDLRLNHRQREIILQATRAPERSFNIASHQSISNIAYGTARSDLLKLEEWGYLTRAQFGNRYEFFPSSKITRNSGKP